ncbi:Hypothetical predicted protein [Octopus vulgaris]|uniref:Histidine-rich glycoprotein-like n=1 Tax=Octopus vulgaris TaxID=6645 RepID=A0AA36BH55_OCTVU|nr:Hypothetical predicted protein [Octopus vulgaris]
MRLTAALVFLVAFALIVGVQSGPLPDDGHTHHDHHQHEGNCNHGNHQHHHDHDHESHHQGDYCPQSWWMSYHTPRQSLDMPCLATSCPPVVPAAVE